MSAGADGRRGQGFAQVAGRAVAGGGQVGTRRQQQGQRASAFAPPGVSPPSMSPPEPSASDPSSAFPHSPYTLLTDLAFSAAVRQYHLQPRGPTTAVASSKFAHFTTIYNVDSAPQPCALSPGAVVQAYRSTNRFNGKQVLLRRVVNAKATAALCTDVTDTYRHFRHPSLVSLLSATHTSEFVLGFTDVIMEYRYVKGATKLTDVAFAGAGLPESTLWSIACQLVSLIRLFHEVGQPLRGLHVSKLLFVEIASRVLFSGIGLLDIAEAGISPKSPQAPEQIEARFREDLQALGLILVQLAARNPTATSLDAATAANLTPPFVTLCNALREGRMKIAEVCRGLGERLANEVGNQAALTDFMLQEGAKEVHNGRLLNLLMKLNLAAHTTAAEGSPLESDHIAIRLFLQYLFQQVDEANQPRHDLGHIYFALNKLDSASDELVQLIGMDNDSVLLVVTFRDLKTALENICQSAMLAASKPQEAAPSSTPGLTSSPLPAGAASPL